MSNLLNFRHWRKRQIENRLSFLSAKMGQCLLIFLSSVKIGCAHDMRHHYYCKAVYVGSCVRGMVRHGGCVCVCVCMCVCGKKEIDVYEWMYVCVGVDRQWLREMCVSVSVHSECGRCEAVCEWVKKPLDKFYFSPFFSNTFSLILFFGLLKNLLEI